MIIYEVNLTVNSGVADQYRRWLEEHIEEMLTLDGFEKAAWYEVEGEDMTKQLWSVHYYLKDRGSLDDYFEKHAQRMRQEGLRRFAGKFSAHRRILNTIEKEPLS